jgi:hypothetical protein
MQKSLLNFPKAADYVSAEQGGEKPCQQRQAG